MRVFFVTFVIFFYRVLMASAMHYEDSKSFVTDAFTAFFAGVDTNAKFNFTITSTTTELELYICKRPEYLRLLSR